MRSESGKKVSFALVAESEDSVRCSVECKDRKNSLENVKMVSKSKGAISEKFKLRLDLIYVAQQ